MPVGAAPASREERRLVEQGQIVDAPGRGRDGGAAAPEEQLPLVVGEQSGCVALQLLAGGQEVADQRGGGDGRPQRVQKRPEVVGRRELPFEPGLVGAEPARRTERSPRFADQTGPQCQPARLVGTGPGDDGGDEVVDPLPTEGRPGEAHTQAHVLRQGPAPPVEGATQELGHACISLHPADRHRLLGPHLGLGRDIADGRLDDSLLAQCGQDLCDVAQEGPARAKDQNAVPAQLGVVVQKEGGPMQPHCGLAGAGSSLDGRELTQGRADDLVLLGLNGGGDVEHLAGASPLELGQEGITAPQPGGGGIVPDVAEEVVGHSHDSSAIDHDLAPTGQPQGVLGAGSIEGHGDGGPPVDDDRIRKGVFHVTPADAPGRAVLLVDATEEEGSWAVCQQRHPSREGGDVIEVGAPGGDQVLQELLGPLPHGPQ